MNVTGWHRFAGRAAGSRSTGRAAPILVLVAAASAVIACNHGAQTHQLALSGDRKTATLAGELPTGPTAADDAAEACQITGPKGPWGYYQRRDLPRGQCESVNPCTLWTKDSCPGTNYPGPAIRWTCACASGTWQCQEQERSKAACPGK
jgi:hypothetical protein